MNTNNIACRISRQQNKRHIYNTIYNMQRNPKGFRTFQQLLYGRIRRMPFFLNVTKINRTKRKEGYFGGGNKSGGQQ